MSARTSLLAVLVFSACPPPVVVTPEEDAGELPAVFDGPTERLGIPDLPSDYAFDASVEIDAGPLNVDTRCCQTNFRISDEEPAGGVTGTLRIALGAFANGVPLTRGGGAWTASVCFPLERSASYQYEFLFDGGLIDGGQNELPDGGVEWVEVTDVRQTVRASAGEPGFELADGTRTNFYRAVSSCDGLDGSVPR